MLRKVIFGAVALLFLTHILYASIKDEIGTLVEQSGIPKESLSVVIRAVNDQSSLYLLHPNVPRIPASIAKVITAYGVLDQFGFDYTIPTKLYRYGEVKDGVLHGDLVIKGYGDPGFESEDLAKIVGAIKRAGIGHIAGNIVIDRTFLKTTTKNSSGFDKNRFSAYNAMPDAMIFNQRVSTVVVDPSTQRIFSKSGDRSFDLEDALIFVDKPCSDIYAYPKISIDTQGQKHRLKLYGKLSRKCPKREIKKVLTRPYLSFYYALKEALKHSSVSVDGDLRLSKVPKGAKLFYTLRSDTMEKMVARMLKKSNNLYARQLFLYLGARYFGAPGTLQKSRRAIREILEKSGIQVPSYFFIDNGSGLSRRSRVSAVLMDRVMQKGNFRYGNRWLELYSIAGVDGTTKRRFKHSSAKSRAWSKTGTLKRVKNITGIVKDRIGRLYSYTMISNSKAGNYKAVALQNRVINHLASYNGALTDKVSNRRSYFVQLGAYTQLPSEIFLDELDLMQIPYRVLNESGHYKLLVGPFSKKEAISAKEKIKRLLDVEGFILSK